MYNEKEFVIEGDFKRYSIGGTNLDGSLTIVVRKDQPADTSNRLRAPAGSPNLRAAFAMLTCRACCRAKLLTMCRSQLLRLDGGGL
jgi:hypothetical protein